MRVDLWKLHRNGHQIVAHGISAIQEALEILKIVVADPQRAQGAESTEETKPLSVELAEKVFVVRIIVEANDTFIRGAQKKFQKFGSLATGVIGDGLARRIGGVELIVGPSRGRSAPVRIPLPTGFQVAASDPEPLNCPL